MQYMDLLLSFDFFSNFTGPKKILPIAFLALFASFTNCSNSLGSDENLLSNPELFFDNVKCFSTIFAPKVTAATDAPIPIV